MRVTYGSRPHEGFLSRTFNVEFLSRFFSCASALKVIGAILLKGNPLRSWFSKNGTTYVVASYPTLRGVGKTWGSWLKNRAIVHLSNPVGTDLEYVLARKNKRKSAYPHLDLLVTFFNFYSYSL